MQLSGLPADMLRLIMQQCDLRSLLSFARCNKATKLIGESKGAWKAMGEPVTVTMQPGRAVPSLTGLLQHCQVSLRFMGHASVEVEHTQPGMLDRRGIDRLHTVPRVRELHLSGWTLNAPEIRRLLAHDSMGNIRMLSLGMHVRFDESCVHSLAVGLPQVNSLRLQQLATPSLCAVLARLSQLTDIRASFCADPFDSMAPHTAAATLQQVRHLRHMLLTPLDILFARLLLSMPIASTLEELTLRDIGGDLTNAPLFAPLITLRCLRIGTKTPAQALRLMCMAARECPTLHELHALHDGHWKQRENSESESVALVHELVQTLPARCRVWIHLEQLRPAAPAPALRSGWMVMPDPWTAYRATLVPCWNETRVILQAVAAAEPERVQFLQDPPRENQLD